MAIKEDEWKDEEQVCTTIRNYFSFFLIKIDIDYNESVIIL